MCRVVFRYTKRKIEFVLAGSGWKKEEFIYRIGLSAKSRNVSVSVFGYVPDIQTFWSSIDVFVAPILSGSGINVKVCEALANGVPVVALPHAVRGFTENVMLCSGVILASSSIDFSNQLEVFRAGDNVFTPPFEFSPNFAEQCLRKVIEKALQ